MSGTERALALAARIQAVAGDPTLSRKAAARELANVDPTDATELLHELMRLARAGDDLAQFALLSISSALTQDAAEIPHAATLRRLALLQDLEDVALFFAAEPAKQVFDAKTAAKKDAQKFTETLGHLKTKARLTRNRDELARLATSQDASVVSNALTNPRMTEELVIRIAARRPTRPEPLLEVWKSARWSLRPAVRRALAFNPYFPPDVAAKLVPLLSRKDLEDVARDNGLPEALRRQAKLLLDNPKHEPPPDPTPQGEA